MPVPPVFYSLAFAEETRAPVEVHLVRPFIFVFGDLVSLVAQGDKRKVDQAEREANRPS